MYSNAFTTTVLHQMFNRQWGSIRKRLWPRQKDASLGIDEFKMFAEGYSYPDDT